MFLSTIVEEQPNLIASQIFSIEVSQFHAFQIFVSGMRFLVISWKSL